MYCCGVENVKLVINYDLIEAVRNVNEPFGPFKVIRNRKAGWAKSAIPFLTGMELLFFHDLHHLPVSLSIFFTTSFVLEMMNNMISGEDLYSTCSSLQLKGLVPKLNDLNISTDYDLLLQSDLYNKKYKIEVNEKQLPNLVESKYILVPTYNFNGDVKDTSVLQEHVVGSKQYVLSLGSPKQEFKLASSKV